jgi:hypothetical protein
MKKNLVCTVAAALALGGCGGSSSSNPATSISALCDKVASLSSNISAKFTPCASGGATVNLPPNSQACQTTMAACDNSSDLNVLNTAVDCMNALPTCSLATLSDFATKAHACAPTGLSPACNAAQQ